VENRVSGVERVFNLVQDIHVGSVVAVEEFQGEFNAPGSPENRANMLPWVFCRFRVVGWLIFVIGAI
jgi:hypothetical protein